ARRRRERAVHHRAWWAAARGHSIEIALEEAVVRIDAAVAQKGPVAPRLPDQAAVALDHQHLFAIVAGAGQDAAAPGGDERRAPKLEIALDADAVDRHDEHAVGNPRAALGSFPPRVLGGC